MVAMYYVYAYCDPRTKLPFYIGKGKGNRWKDHLVLCGCKSKLKRLPYFYAKLRKMLSEGVAPQIVKVFEGAESACFQTERTLIQSYGRKCDGGPLCNLTDGGEGSWGLKHSLETIEKVRSARLGQKHSLETRKKIRDSHLGHKHSSETRERISASRKTPVEGFDLITGEVIHQFPSIKEAIQCGFNHVSKVAKGRRKTCKGLGWRYADEG